MRRTRAARCFQNGGVLEDEQPTWAIRAAKKTILNLDSFWHIL